MFIDLKMLATIFDITTTKKIVKDEQGLRMTSEVDLQLPDNAQKVRLKKFQVGEALLRLDDLHPGSPIVRVPEAIRDLIVTANRMCRFVLKTDGRTNFGTGFLVGPSQVLTAAHLFFNKDGSLIGRSPADISVEFQTLMTSDFGTASGAPRPIDLRDPDWLADPLVKDDGKADRDVALLDYVIVNLKTIDDENGVGKEVGNEELGLSERRGWFEIPPPREAPLLAEETMLRIFQYVDRGDLRTSVGFVKRFSQQRRRIHYTASTLDAASGALVRTDDKRIVGIHVSGGDPELPNENRALPIRHIATALGDRRRELSPCLKPV